MGKIIDLNGGLYQYEIPLKEPSEKDILYYNLPKKEQYWRSAADQSKQVDIKDVKMMSEKDRIAYISMWRERWLNGMWFMNNGEPTYITGMHIDHLVFNKFNGGHLSYLDSQRLRFYFRDMTNNEAMCDGRIWTKPRRAGITYEQRTEAIRCVLSGYGFNVGMQSTKDEVCARTLMKPIIDSYLSRPRWMREKIDMPNGRKPKKVLELISSKFNDDVDDDSLGGYIRGFSTTATAFDSDAWMLLILDEFSKWETCNPRESFDIGKKAASNPGRRGKMDCLSTTGDSKDAVKATIEWHKLIAESNPQRRDKNGKTISGLYKYFISAIDSFLVMEELSKQGKVNTDIYGFVNKEMSEEWIWNEHKKYPEGTKEHIFSLYKLPLKEEHTLLSSSISSIFSKPRISARLSILESLLPDERPYVRGRLEEDQDGKVYFEADPTGYWLWAVHPFFSVERNIDLRNRFRVSGDKVFFPPINPAGCIGYDPINYSKGQTKSSNVSQAAGFIRIKFDYFNTGVEDEVMALLLYRPDDPHDANKEIMKACRYTSFPCMHERSIPHVYEDFRDLNMLPFLMKGEDGLYGTLANSKNLKDGISMLQARYAPPKSEGQKDQIMTHPFEDCLRSHDNFDPDNTGQFDPTMAEIQCEHGLKQLKYTNAVDYGVDNAMQWFNEMIAPRKKAV